MKPKLKTLFAFLFAFALTQNAFAQFGYEDVVYLKNGSVIHGIIIEQIPNVSIKIQTKNRDIFVFKMEEIEKITKEQKAERLHGRRKIEKAPRDTSSEPYTGYALTVEGAFGEGIGTHNQAQPTYGVHVVNGAMIKGIFSAGIGVGFDFLNGDNNYGPEYNNIFTVSKHEYVMVGFFMDLRAFPLKGKVSPLVILDLGYGKALFSQATHGGLLLNAGLGAKIKINKRMGFNMSLNYKMQNIIYDGNSGYYYNYGSYSYDAGSITLSYLCLQFGFTL